MPRTALRHKLQAARVQALDKSREEIILTHQHPPPYHFFACPSSCLFNQPDARQSAAPVVSPIPPPPLPPRHRRDVPHSTSDRRPPKASSYVVFFAAADVSSAARPAATMTSARTGRSTVRWAGSWGVCRREIRRLWVSFPMSGYETMYCSMIPCSIEFFYFPAIILLTYFQHRHMNHNLTSSIPRSPRQVDLGGLLDTAPGRRR